jgi:small subunit ribosomal protein S19
MARSVWKGPYVHPSLLRKPPTRLKGKLTSKNTSIREVWARSSTVLPSWVGCTLRVHNGRRFQTVTIKKECVGHKLGEFVLTRKRAIHLKKAKLAAARKR